MTKKQKIILLAVLILGVSTFLGLLFYGRQPQGIEQELKVEDAATSPSKQKIEEVKPLAPSKNPIGIEIPKSILFYNGTVKEVKKSSLIISTEAVENYLTEDAIFEVQVDNNTQIIQQTMPMYLPPGKSPREVVQDTIIALKDLKPGDRVTVSGGGNLAGLTEFTAREIKKLEIRN